MLNLIAAALVAAAPVPPADAHAQQPPMGQMSMGDMKPGDMKPGDMKPGAMAAMKDDCCCKDMMAKMDAKNAAHQGQNDQHHNHQ